MKTKLLLLTLVGSMLAAFALLAQSNSATNNSQNFGRNLSTNSGINSTTASVTNAPTRNYPGALAGEQLVFAPGLKENLKLTDVQRVELKLIEDDFAKTRQEYKVANQPRIDAAQPSIRSNRC